MKITKTVPYFIITTLLLSGCGKKQECDIPTRHVHLYTKEITNNVDIATYFDSEYLIFDGYDRNDSYLEINKKDEEIYNYFTRYNLFKGIDNWEYLYYEMANNHDYLEFYYSYYTTEEYTTTDSKGNIEVHTRQVHHSGWTKNPNYSHNTGETKLCHHRYYGYKIVYENNHFVLKRSKGYDDIREILEEYPYYCIDGTTIVSEYFNFSTSRLRYLKPEDFDVFNQPDLDNKTPYLNNIRID